MSSGEIDQSLHFLIVDDDAESRSTLVEYLRVLGYAHVTLAHDGTEAIRLLDRDPSINFIISDWDMPLMNGLTLLQRVKFNPERSHIPFLVMTSPVSAEAEKVILAAENMVDGYLIKPFRSHLLEEKIKTILNVSALGLQKQVLVVDDDEDATETIIDYIKQMGFKDIVSFKNGVEALKYLNQSFDRVGLIVSDWEMPQMSGIELLRACKSSEKLSDIPFLMVTSQTSIERMKVMQAARANVDQYMLKPFNANDFHERIKTVLEKSRLHPEVRKLNLEGLEHLENGRFQNAQIKFEEALKCYPESEIALSGMGDVLNRTKGPQAAMPFFKKAIDVNPVNPKTYIKLARLYEQMNLMDQAVALLQTGNQQVGFNADLHFSLGKLYSKKKMYDQAKKEFEKTLEIQLEHQEARLMLEMINSQRKG
jgi:two-component system, chemotaxis family, chemotaxis protein CheY